MPQTNARPPGRETEKTALDTIQASVPASFGGAGSYLGGEQLGEVHLLHFQLLPLRVLPLVLVHIWVDLDQDFKLVVCCNDGSNVQEKILTKWKYFPEKFSSSMRKNETLQISSTFGA